MRKAQDAAIAQPATNASVVREVLHSSVPELTEMARWKSDGHTFPAIRILGRIAGWKNEEIWRAWREGDVEKIIAAASGE
jgi:hypothetical protein